MSTFRVPPHIAKRKWYGLAQRHRRMAVRLLRSGFIDRAVFHAYHAYECVVSALIASQGLPVPTSHASRFTLYSAIHDATKPYAATQSQLIVFTIRERNEALYYDEVRDQLPADRFHQGYAAWVLPLVHQFAREVWDEIR